LKLLMEETFIEVRPGEQLFARIWQPKTQPLAITCLVHGLSDHSGRFTGLAEELSKHGYIFIAPDLRGNGKSPGVRGDFDSLSQVLDDIKAIIDYSKSRFAGLPVFLYGQSMGGNLAINFALRHPSSISGVISSSPWLRLTNPPSRIVRIAAAILKPLFPKMLINNGLKSTDLCHDTVVQSAYDNDPLIHWKVSLSTFFIINNGGEWAVENAGLLQLPLLLMHGDADMITSFEASREFARKAGQNCTFIEWPGLYHELHNEPGRDAIYDAVNAWLSSQTKST